MTATVLSGTDAANRLYDTLREDIAALKHKGVTPCLAVILVGDQPASAVYVRHKMKAAEAIGVHVDLHHLPDTVTQTELESLIDSLNTNTDTHGIITQLPLPDAIDSDVLLDRIDPAKDVDGFHPVNIGKLAQKRPALRSCTPKGIITLLEQNHIDCVGKHAVVIGASNIVGRPMALELLLKRATVTVCHSKTTDLQHHVAQADILVSCTGQRGLIESGWIKLGSVVIDVGIHRLEDGRLSGDLDFDAAQARASAITPVPGGVGPMTVAALLENTVQACAAQSAS